VVVLVHGIGSDMTAGGVFVPLAEELAEAGFTVLRFSFRGHGRSGGTQRGMTIAGELLDLQAAVELAAGRYGRPLAIVAWSFGAVPVVLSLPWLGAHLERFALWSPVLDLRRTFVDPELPWGVENFGADQQKLLTTQGYLTFQGGFDVGRVLFDEFCRYEPLACFTASPVPALVVHGDRDVMTSHAIARQAAAGRPNTVFRSVHGADHGFGSPRWKDEVSAVTIEWLAGGRLPG
jgi:alpha-beta hydrolase superfamily lysophospholipase